MSDYDGGTPTSDFSTTEGVIDYTLPLGKVRLLITDTADVVADRLFTDDQLDAFLAMADDSILRTAAKALLVIATSEVLLGKKIRTQDLSTDGPAVSAELRALAKQLLEEAATAEDTGGWFDVVGFEPYTHLEGAEYRL